LYLISLKIITAFTVSRLKLIKIAWTVFMHQQSKFKLKKVFNAVVIQTKSHYIVPVILFFYKIA